MDTAVNIWNLLWDYQIEIAVFFVFLIWMVVRGWDLFRWIFRKLGLIGKKEVPESPKNESGVPVRSHPGSE